ncbi:hypothetical protein BSKO_00237 [Bryopsis sp. KO-2023]|nr:hypothetical protein BSKO_00237 [Bryopsis sp. KO-2023]
MGILGSGSIHMQSRFPRRAARGRDGNGQQRCQRCLQIGHWTYECKNPPAFAKRPSRSQQLKDPKCRQRLMDPDELPDECKPLTKKQKTAPSPSSTSTSSSSSSSSESGSSSATSSSSSSSSDGSSSSSGRSTGSSSSSSSGSDSDSDVSRERKKSKNTQRNHRSSGKSAKKLPEKASRPPTKNYTDRDIAEWKRKVESMGNKKRVPIPSSSSGSSSGSDVGTPSRSGSESDGGRKGSEKSLGRWQPSRRISEEFDQHHVRHENRRGRIDVRTNPSDSRGGREALGREKDRYSYGRGDIDQQRRDYGAQHIRQGRDGGDLEVRPRLKSEIQLGEREKSPSKSDGSGGRWGMA